MRNQPIRLRLRPRGEENLTGYVFMAPALFVLGTFIVLPILYAVFLSWLTDKSYVQRREIAGIVRN
jgi:ABC-type sugar transport system permease subunit